MYVIYSTGSTEMRYALAAFMLAYVLPAGAQDTHHHQGMSAAVDTFYSTWFMPDKPTQSCCNKADCYVPEQTRFRANHWEFLRREDRQWVSVPTFKVEQNRDNPDGQTHVCAPGPGERSDGQYVFCFSVGSGT